MSSVDLLPVSCALCTNDSAEPVAIQNGYRMVQCAGCGFVYLSPRPDPEALISLYHYYHERNGKSAETWDVLMERNFRETAALLEKWFPQHGRLLDIGCGYGHFIGMMRRHGWEVSGIEPSKNACAFAQSKGLPVVQNSFESAEYPAGSFDAITAFYVLEHVYDPLTVLKKIRSLLKPGGMLVLRIPHTTPIVRLLALIGVRNNLYDAPFHLSDFSPGTIRCALEKTGFKEIRVVPGHPTVPPRRGERLVSLAAGNAARLLFSASGGRLLMPGVSKTVTARNQESRDA